MQPAERDRTISALSDSESEHVSFEDLGLSPDVLKAVSDAGYTAPTPIQAQAIPYVLMGRDILGCAQTGTGKTASFTLPMIEVLARGRARARMPRSLILTPTRELAAQVAENFNTYGKYHKLTMALLIGGSSFGPQLEKLDRGVDVLIATPGRLIDHFERGGILLTDVKTLVIDEADRMLDMGFIPDVERIVGFLPKIRQTLFFSATYPPEVRRLADQFLMNPKEITVSPSSSAAETVEHSVVRSPSKDFEKRATLRAILAAEDVKNALIFCNRKRDVDVLAKSLKQHGFSAAALHGDMAQSARTETLDAFRANKITYLVATDVAGRGLDIAGLSHVFNFDVPFHAEDYIHRIGRTGRAGAAGRAFMLVTKADAKFLSAIERLLDMKLDVTEIEGVASDAGPAQDADEAPRGRSRKGSARKPRSAKADDTAADTPEAGPKSRKAARNDDSPAPSEKPKSRARPAKDKPADVKPADDKPADDKPARGKSRGTSRGTDSGKPAAKGNERKPRKDGDEVIGLGDHMPAFLTVDPLAKHRGDD